MATLAELRAAVEASSQEHLLPFIADDASPSISEQLQRWNVLSNIHHFAVARQSSAATAADTGTISADICHIPQDNILSYIKASQDERDLMFENGCEAIAQGHVCAVIMSGGQGTRLGFAGPKGMYDMQLPSGKTIFQLHMERVNRVREIVRKKKCSSKLEEAVSIPVYIMTSDLNDSIIRDFFAAKNFFGFPPEDVYFFEQGLMPCFDEQGCVIVESASALSLSPDGNGGIYNAMAKCGVIADMQRRGIKHIHVYGIDNVLTKSVDPSFLGACISRGVDVGNKIVWRASNAEKVGVTVSRGSGSMSIIEYSELPPLLADSLDDAGKLVFGAANICNHYMSLAFVVNKVLPTISSSYHLAAKKIPYYDADLKQTITPSKNNGYKLEMFVFDVFPLADKWLVFDCDRSGEFAPVKNEPGNPSDSPDTARAMINALSRKWLTAAGALVDEGAGVVEISPLLSYDGEGLQRFSGLSVTAPCYLH